MPAEPDFTVGEKLDDPPAQIEEDLQPQVAGPVSRSARRPALQPAAAARSFDQALRTLDKSRRRAVGRSRSIKTPCGCSSTPEVRRAFELADEPADVREAYGRTKIGGRCLLARRLVEAGARFVMVDYGYDPDYGNLWDNHNAPVQNHPPIQEMCRRGYHLAGIDQAFAALIPDLDDRGLLDTTLVVLPHRVRPHAEDQPRRRPRSLGRGRLAVLHRRRHQDGPGHRRDRPHGQ